jgi:hypothetical protein
MEKPNILISIPTKNWVHSGTMIWAIKELKDTEKHDVGIHVISSPLPLEVQRNNQIIYFLADETPYTHIFLLDSDNVPELGTLQKLLDHDKDVVHTVGAAIIKGSLVFSASCKNPLNTPDEPYVFPGITNEESHGLRQIDACGASGLLIKRHVLQTIKYPYFKFVVTEDNKVVLGEDLYFCEKIKEAGFEIWADFDLRMKHVSTIVI